MRNQKQVGIQIEEKTTRTFTVYEVRVKDLRELLTAEDLGSSLLDLGEKYLPLFTDATIDDLDTLYPSDLEKLYHAAREVNRPLLNAAKALNLGPLRERMTSLLLNDLMSFAAGLLPPDTPGASSTDGAFSSPPSSRSNGSEKSG